MIFLLSSFPFVISVFYDNSLKLIFYFILLFSISLLFLFHILLCALMHIIDINKVGLLFYSCPYLNLAIWQEHKCFTAWLGPSGVWYKDYLHYIKPSSFYQESRPKTKIHFQTRQKRKTGMNKKAKCSVLTCVCYDFIHIWSHHLNVWTCSLVTSAYLSKK